jgi:hypothetical protein
VKAAGSTMLSATLNSGASVSATVNGMAAALSVVAAPPRIYVAKNTAASLPLLVQVAGNGSPLNGRLIEFEVMLGPGTLSAARATTDSKGEGSTTLSIAEMTSEIRVSACVGVAPQSACDIFYVYAVSTITGARLIKAGGDEQYVVPGKLFLPVTVRVADLSDPPNGVAGVAVKFHMTAFKQTRSERQVVGEVSSGRFAASTVVASEEVTVHTNGWGLASYIPRVSAPGAIIQIEATSGTSAVDFALHTWEVEGSASPPKQQKLGWATPE